MSEYSDARLEQLRRARDRAYDDLNNAQVDIDILKQAGQDTSELERNKAESERELQRLDGAIRMLEQRSY